MASSSTWILSLKVVLISTGVVSIAMVSKFSVPLILDFVVYQVPLIWSTLLSWLKPPYLYVIINGIIITIAASSRFYHKIEQPDHEYQSEPLVSPTPPPPTSDLDSDYAAAVSAARPEFGGAVEPIAVYETDQFTAPPEVKDVVVYGAEVGDDHDDDEDEDEFVISRSTWTPPQRMTSPEIQTEYLFPVTEKPLVSSRFGHRKPIKSSPEGGRPLRVAKHKRQETLENTWKMITDGRHVPLTRHLKKSDTWNSNGRQNTPSPVDNTPPPHMGPKSETFKDRTNYDSTNSSPGSARLRKEPSLSQDELNRRVEAFIRKFNEDMRLQRQKSLNQYVEMINRGAH